MSFEFNKYWFSVPELVPVSGNIEISETVNIIKEFFVGETACQLICRMKKFFDYLVFIRSIITKQHITDQILLALKTSYIYA